ncbi:MAG: hypothetical protein ACKVW3_04290 [Phycisphaerales bacterium]
MPSLSAARGRGLAIKTLSNMRSFGMGLNSYCNANKDAVPAFYAPKLPPFAPFKFDFGPLGDGSWFAHSYLAALAITAELDDVRIATAPGNPKPFLVREHRGQQVSLSDYRLSETLYAMPRFFNATTMGGPEQWGSQRLTDIRYPSIKGIIVQRRLYHYPQYGVLPACCSSNIPSPVMFGDMSVSEEDIGSMPKGIGNPYVRTSRDPSADPVGHSGPPIIDTIDGIAGRDKVKLLPVRTR